MSDRAEIRCVPAQDERVETGVVRFGDDWPGVFLRGDDAFDFFLTLKYLSDMNGPLIYRKIAETSLRRLLRLMAESNESPGMRAKMLSDLESDEAKSDG